MAEQLLSVGIDVGTSTTQVVFTHLHMEDTAGYFSVPQVEIVEKEILYQSEIHLTPLLNAVLIDVDALKAMVIAEFEQAKINPSQVHSGAVMITGESARKENAALVLEKLSDLAGEFVVSTAGPDLESILAGKGSGAQQYAKQHACYTANIDIGGGTSNLVLFAPDGEIAAKGCLDIGGRQIKRAPDATLTYISKSAQHIAQECGLSSLDGSVISLNKICQYMAQCLLDLLGGQDTLALRALQTTGSTWFSPPMPVQAVSFSGGVADCIYKSGIEPFAYGDIGVLLGKAIRESELFTRFFVITPSETIRATVVGAGSYTTTISGSTIAYDTTLFPQKNLPVLKLTEPEEVALQAGKAEQLAEKLRWFLTQCDTRQIVIAVCGEKNPSYPALQQFAKAISEAVEQVYASDIPLFLAVEQDIGKALGHQLRRCNVARKLVVVDQLKLTQGDYMDMGYPVMQGLAIPVVIKTLIFG